MPLMIVRNDITKMKVDAIVNAANRTLLGGGGVDGCIHRAAGPELLAECRTLGGCMTGAAKLTGGYNLPCKYVIHTVGPVWQGGGCGEEEALTSCYTRSLTLALEKGCETVAFPLISSGVYGYPKDKALTVATRAIGRFLESYDLTVYLVIFDRATFAVSGSRYSDIQQYIDDHYVATHSSPTRRDMTGEMPDILGIPCPRSPIMRPDVATEECAAPFSTPKRTPKAKSSSAGRATPDTGKSLEERLKHLDESFSQMLLRLIDAKGMTDAQCYKKANIHRKLFSKIRSDPYYRASKPTVLAFAVALELTLEETRELLMRAGFALSPANKFDLIVEYFIARGNYDVFAINEALFAFDQSLLGGC